MDTDAFREPGHEFAGSVSANEMQLKIKQTVQEILDARAKYSDSSLADLYDVLTMPPQLRTAHQYNDRAIMPIHCFRETGTGPLAVQSPVKQ